LNYFIFSVNFNALRVEHCWYHFT